MLYVAYRLKTFSTLCRHMHHPMYNNDYLKNTSCYFLFYLKSHLKYNKESLGYQSGVSGISFSYNQT